MSGCVVCCVLYTYAEVDCDAVVRRWIIVGVVGVNYDVLCCALGCCALCVRLLCTVYYVMCVCAMRSYV